MLEAERLLLIGGSMMLLLAVAGFVLTQRNAWRVIMLLITLLGGLNIGFFIWSELLIGTRGLRIFLFWIAALLPPLVGLAFGAGLGYLVNWRISKISTKRDRR